MPGGWHYLVFDVLSQFFLLSTPGIKRVKNPSSLWSWNPKFLILAKISATVFTRSTSWRLWGFNPPLLLLLLNLLRDEILFHKSIFSLTWWLLERNIRRRRTDLSQIECSTVNLWHSGLYRAGSYIREFLYPAPDSVPSFLGTDSRAWKSGSTSCLAASRLTASRRVEKRKDWMLDLPMVAVQLHFAQLTEPLPKPCSWSWFSWCSISLKKIC